MSTHDFVTPKEARKNELHQLVHKPTIQWFDYVRQNNISNDYYLSPKVSQAVRCLAFEMYCNAAEKDTVDTEADAGALSFYVYLISLGAAVQSAVADGDLEFLNSPQEEDDTESL